MRHFCLNCHFECVGQAPPDNKKVGWEKRSGSHRKNFGSTGRRSLAQNTPRGCPSPHPLPTERGILIWRPDEFCFLGIRTLRRSNVRLSKGCSASLQLRLILLRHDGFGCSARPRYGGSRSHVAQLLRCLHSRPMISLAGWEPLPGLKPNFLHLATPTLLAV